MNREEASAPHPAFLPPGTLIGPWRVVAWAGRGVYGAVYKAVRAEQENAGPVALKLALHPGDPRFAREVELLRRQHHPGIPRFQDAGAWRHPSDTPPSDPPGLPAPPPDGQDFTARSPIPEKASTEKAPSGHFLPWEDARPRRAMLTTAAAGLVLLGWAWWTAPDISLKRRSAMRTKAVQVHQEDGGATGLGEAASPDSPAVSPDSSEPRALAEETPPEPLPGQLRPDAKGRCPHKRHVALNGACWVPEDCSVFGGQIFKGRCYVPAMPSARKPRFTPSHRP